MPIDGYKRAVLDNEFELLDLSEVSFDLLPDDLRRVARFLEHYAAEIESGGAGEIAMSISRPLTALGKLGIPPPT